MFVSRETCAYVSIERNTLYVSRIIEIRYSRGGSRKNVLGTWDIRNMPCAHINRDSKQLHLAATSSSLIQINISRNRYALNRYAKGRSFKLNFCESAISFVKEYIIYFLSYILNLCLSITLLNR